MIVTATWSDGLVPHIKGGSLCDTVYDFHSMVFHWGPSNDEGSEHTLDYVKHTMELQMIHVKHGHSSPLDKSLLGTKDGVAIISFFFQVSYN